MPKISINEKDKAIKGVISKYLGMRDLKKKDLARITCIPGATLYKALKDMSYMRVYQLRVYQLRLIYDALRVPMDERVGL